MKRIALFVLTAVLALTVWVRPFSSAEAATSSSYARAVVRDAYFFTEKDLSSSLFAVPYTYCVEVLRDDGEWYYARYANDTGVYKALYGYCRKSDFTPVEGTPEVTFLYKIVTVTYQSGENSSTLPVLGEINLEAAFYGTFYSGATAYSYVYSQGSFGYISGANDDYPLNLVEDEPSPEPAAQDGQNVNVGLIAALVICALAAAALIMLFFTSKKRPDRNG